MTAPLLILALVVLALATGAALVAPLLRRKAQVVSAARFDRAVYRDQLREVERDMARGVLNPDEAGSARLEIERRLLATRESGTGEPPASRRRTALAVAIAVVMAAWAAGLYLLLGAPGVPDMPLAARVATNGAQGDHPDIAAIAAKLEARLEATGGDADTWLLLARTESGLQQWDKSADAYRHVLDLKPAAAGTAIEVAYAEALTLAADGIVTPAAREALDRVLAHDPGNQIARFYVALAAAQAGDMTQAITIWTRLAGELPADSDMRAEIARRVGEAAHQAGIAPPPLPPPAAAPRGQ